MGSTNLGFGSDANEAGKKPVTSTATDNIASNKLLEASRFGAPEQSGGSSSGVAKFALPDSIFRAEKQVIPKAETLSVGAQPITRASVTSDLVSGNQVQANAAQLDSRYFNPAQTDTHGSPDAIAPGSTSVRGSQNGAVEALDVKGSSGSGTVRTEGNVVTAPATIPEAPRQTIRQEVAASPAPSVWVEGTRVSTTDRAPAQVPGPGVKTDQIVPSISSARTDSTVPLSPSARTDSTVPLSPSTRTDSTVPLSSSRGDNLLPLTGPARTDNSLPVIVPTRTDNVVAPSAVVRADNTIPVVNPRNDSSPAIPARVDAVPSNQTVARSDAPISTPSVFSNRPFVDLVGPAVNATHSDNTRGEVTPVATPGNSQARDLVTNSTRDVGTNATQPSSRTSDSTIPATATPGVRPDNTSLQPAVKPEVVRDSAPSATSPPVSDRSNVVAAFMQPCTDAVQVNRATQIVDKNTPVAARTSDSPTVPVGQPLQPDRPVSTPTNAYDRNAPGSSSAAGDRLSPTNSASPTIPGSDRSTPTSTTNTSDNTPGQRAGQLANALTSPLNDNGTTARPTTDLSRTNNVSDRVSGQQPTDARTDPRTTDQSRPGNTDPLNRSNDLPGRAVDPSKPSDQLSRASDPKPGDLPGRVPDPTKVGDQPARATDPAKPGDQPGRVADPARPGDQPGRTIDPAKPGDQPGRTIDPAKPGDQPGRSTDPARPGDQPGRTTDPARPGDQPGRTTDPARPGDQPGRSIDAAKPGDQPGRSTDATRPGDQPGRSSDATRPGDQPGRVADTRSGDQPGRGVDTTKPGDFNRTADNTRTAQDGVQRPAEPGRDGQRILDGRGQGDNRPGDQFRPDGARQTDGVRPGEGTKNFDPTAKNEVRANESVVGSKFEARNNEPPANKFEPLANKFEPRNNEQVANKFEGRTNEQLANKFEPRNNEQLANKFEPRNNEQLANRFDGNRQDFAANKANELNQRNAEIRANDPKLNERVQDNSNTNQSENIRGQFGHRWQHDGNRNQDTTGAQRPQETTAPRNWDAQNTRAPENNATNPGNRLELNNKQEASTRAQDTNNANRASDAASNRTDLTANRANENAAAHRNPDAAAHRNPEASIRSDNANRNESRPEPAVRQNEIRTDSPKSADNTKLPDAPKPDPNSSNVPVNRTNDNRTDIPNTRNNEQGTDSRRAEHTPNKSADAIAGSSRSDSITDRANQFIDAGKQQPQFAPGLVATQKEADAIRQILNELKQNQNLTSSEVLELPSFKDAIRLLDSIRHKDTDGERDHKQNFPTQLVEAMRLSEFLKVLEKASEQEQRKIHQQQWAERSVAQQHRVRYLVKNGDTLESIAEEILGDKRFVPLLITINRAEIIFTAISGTTEAIVYEGQYLWIPTPNEVSIHQKHYFAPNAAAVRGEPISPAAETPIRVEELEAPTTVQEFAARPKTFIAPPVVKPENPASTPMALVLYRLRFAGNRNSVNLDEVKSEDQAPTRRQHKVRLGETVQSIAIHDPQINDVNMWVLVCRLNGLDTSVDAAGRPRAQLTKGESVWLPTADEIEEFKVISRLMQIAQLAGQNVDADMSKRFTPVGKEAPEEQISKSLCRIDRKMVIEKIIDHCRMIMTDNPDKSYGIKLQRESVDGKWITVAAYECKEGKTYRYTYKVDGSKNCLEVGLPASVSREMAIEDFQRNWRFYYNRYTSMKTDTLELNFSEQHRTNS
ncbi:MAG TPA: hypothetical protein V6C76_18195 [Drouetiella sp.]